MNGVIRDDRVVVGKNAFCLFYCGSMVAVCLFCAEAEHRPEVTSDISVSVICHM